MKCFMQVLTYLLSLHKAAESEPARNAATVNQADLISISFQRGKPSIIKKDVFMTYKDHN